MLQEASQDLVWRAVNDLSPPEVAQDHSIGKLQAGKAQEAVHQGIASPLG